MDNLKIQDSPTIKSRPFMATFVMIGGTIALLLGLVISISVGAADIGFWTVWEAVFHFNPELSEHTVIQEIRLPRSIADVLVGACFAVAGAIMQGMTRNPLADSGLLGINAGSIFMVALCFAFLPGISYNTLILFSFIGAGISLALIYGVGSMAKNGMSPVRLVVAGAAVSALLTALSEGIAIYFNISQDLAFWYAGGVSGVQWLQVKYMFPWIVAGLIGAMMIARSITLLSLGEEVATGLGQRTKLVKIVGVLIVLVLAGVAVSAVGPIGFVGLLIPHLTRFLVGVDYRYIIPCSAILGGLFMTIADIGARMINPPYETPIGFIFALIGVPFFLYVARNERRAL